MLGRLTTLASESGFVSREAGYLHRYSLNEGMPRNEIDSALSWLNEVEDQVKPQNRPPYNLLHEQLEGADDLRDLPMALIHPDPVMKNLISNPRDGLTLIDWAGAVGPRLASIAVLIWSSALGEQIWSPESVDAAIEGYRAHAHSRMRRSSGWEMP